MHVVNSMSFLGLILRIFAVTAKGFEYDDLYVTAHLELPECEYWMIQ